MVAPNRLRTRLQLESLEDRTVPAPLTFTVSNLLDGVTGSLRERLDNANLHPGPDTIVFDPSLSGTIELIDGALPITDDVVIVGPGAAVITISGRNTSRILQMGNAASEPLVVTISGLTLTQGNAGDLDSGGAVEMTNGVLQLRGMTIAGNVAREGGGISAHGRLIVDDSTIPGNIASGGFGGAGIFVDSGTVLTVTNSTISSNICGVFGGGISIRGISDVQIRSSTIAFNGAFSSNGGGIIVDSGASVLLQSTIVANNTFGMGSDIVGTVTATNCLVQITTSTAFAPGSTANITGVDPMLAPLGNNGGPTPTHALLAGSPAKNAGANPAGLPNDQRGPGFARVVGPAADIGAFEDQTLPPPPPISPEPTPHALQAAAQIVQTLQRVGSKLAAFAFAETNGDTVKDIVVAFRLRNGKLLIATVSGANGGVAGAFQPFSRPLATNARVQLLPLNLNADPLLDLGLIINGGGTGIPRVSAFTVAGARLL
jgi:hypothetical protein